MKNETCFCGWLLAGSAMMFSAFATSVDPVAEQTLWVKGANGYDTYRIPAIVTTKDGSLLAFCEGRKNAISDTGNIDVVMRRSSDGGVTWGVQQVVWDDGSNTCGNPVPIIDQSSGRIVLVMTWNLGTDGESAIIAKTSADTRRVFVATSDDDGVTWSTAREITATAKLQEWGWYATGPGGGIQLRTGEHAGRLVVACDHSDAAKAYKSHVIFSDDAGTTWQLGGVVPDVKLNECQVVELADGRLLINMRNYDRPLNSRRVSFSSDAGVTWSAPVYDPALIEPICEASVERVRLPDGDAPGVVAFLNPASETSRVNLTLRLSFTEAATWAQSRVLFAGPSAYSDLAMTAAGEIAALYECGVSSAYDEIRFTRVALSETATTNTSSTPSSASAVFEDGLQAWFHADEGVNLGSALNGQGVTNWVSSGASQVTVVQTSAAASPYYVAEAFQRADGSYAPAVRFNRNMADTATVSGQPHWLYSTSNTTLKVTSDSTWLIVYRLTDNMQQASFFGLNEGGPPRFGGFFLGYPAYPYNTFRAHNANSTASMNVRLEKRVPALLDSRRKGAAMEAQLGGSVTARITNASDTLANASQFRIGAMMDGVPAHAVADVAELLIYNRAVNDAERVILQNALAARYGLSLSGTDVYAGGDGPRQGFCDGAAGIGKYTALLNANGGSVTSGVSSGGLTLEALNGTLNADGEFVMAGYRGVTNYWIAADAADMRLAREWYVQKTTADGVDVRLKFTLTDAGVASPGAVTYALFYRADRSQAFTVVNATASVNGDAVSFDLNNADMPTGCYTLGVGTPWEAAIEAPFLADGMSAWFRADQGVVVPDAATQAVQAWQSVWGSAGLEAAPSLATQAPVRVAQAFERAAGVYEPAVRFNWDGSAAIAGLPQVLKSRFTTVLNVESDNTWFVVGRALGAQRNQGLFGLDQTASRFGAFFLGTADSTAVSRIRTHSFNVWQTLSPRPEANVINHAAFLADARRNSSTNGAAGICGSLNGTVMQAADWRPADITAPIAAPFYIGNQLMSDGLLNLAGDIAEIRVYNRALNDAERVILQNHLAARYGLTLADSDFYRGKLASAGDYDLDVVGVGCSAVAGGGRVPGVVAQSEDSSGLRLAGLNNTLGSGGEFVFAGRTGVPLEGDGWTNAVSGETYVKRWQRAWYVSVPGLDGVDVRLTFDFATSGLTQGAETDWVLLYRKTMTNAFVAVPSVTAVTNGTAVAFDVLNDWLLEGQYTLGVGDPSPVRVRDVTQYGAGVTGGLRAWFRASDELASDGGSVTNWGNLGLTGSLLDMSVAAGTPQKAEAGPQRAAGVFEPVVRFNGASRLISRAVSDLEVFENASWFVVFSPTGARANRGLFGMDTDVTGRFGCFFTGGVGEPLRCHMFNQNNLALQSHLYGIQQDAFQIADYSRQRLSSVYALSARLDGAVKENKLATQWAPGVGRLKIGNVLADSTTLENFIGDIAELRIYSRALNDVERMIVQNHLAARYGTTLATNDVYSGKESAAGDFDLGVVGIGCTTNAATGYIPGTVEKSESSAGLSVEALNGTLDEDGECLLAGYAAVANAWIHSGSAATDATCRWQREWHLDKTSANGLNVRVTFNFSAAGVAWREQRDEAEYKLLWRADASSTYRDTGLTPVTEGDSLSFDVGDADLSDGLYTVGALTAARGSVILLR